MREKPFRAWLWMPHTQKHATLIDGKNKIEKRTENKHMR
jgi:hypothetical protein